MSPAKPLANTFSSTHLPCRAVVEALVQGALQKEQAQQAEVQGRLAAAKREAEEAAAKVRLHNLI